MTPEEIRVKSEKFTVGAKIIVKETSREPTGSVTTLVHARVIERYSHHLVVEKKNGVRESFTYWDALRELELIK